METITNKRGTWRVAGVNKRFKTEKLAEESLGVFEELKQKSALEKLREPLVSDVEVDLALALDFESESDSDD